MTNTFEELIELAEDREVWKQLAVRQIGPKQNVRPSPGQTPPAAPSASTAPPPNTSNDNDTTRRNQTLANVPTTRPTDPTTHCASDAASAVTAAMQMDEDGGDVTPATSMTRAKPGTSDTNNNSQPPIKKPRHRYNTRLRKRIAATKPPTPEDPVKSIKEDIARKRNKCKKKKPKPTPWSDARRQNWAREYYNKRFGNDEPIRLNWDALVASANASAKTTPPMATNTTTATTSTPTMEEMRQVDPPRTEAEPHEERPAALTATQTKRKTQMEELRRMRRRRFARNQTQPHTQTQPITQTQPQQPPRIQSEQQTQQSKLPQPHAAKTKLLQQWGRKRFARRKQQNQAQKTPKLSAAAAPFVPPRKDPSPADPSRMETPGSPSLWAEAVPYDSSCMDSRSLQSTPRQTPIHHHIMGHHTSNTQHTNSPQHRHICTDLFDDITLSPITLTQDTSLTHIYDQQSPPTQMNESHPFTHPNPTHPHMNETYSHSTSYDLNITFPTLTHLHMNDTPSHHTSYNQTHSHSLTYMNDTYLVVFNHTQDNNI